MKIWILTVKYGFQDLDSFVCFCDEDPTELLLSNDYADTLFSLEDELYCEYGYLYKEDLTDEDTEDWSSEDFDEYEDAQYQDFCEHLSFEAYETDTPEGYSILIDERIDEI